jgi:hypothetical protein
MAQARRELSMEGVLINRRSLVIAAALVCMAQAAAAAPPPRPDLADAIAGGYGGDVISDSQGSSREGVSLTLTRTGPDTVQITSDYPRLPTISVHLTRAMGKILNDGGDTPLVYDPDKAPPHLDVSFHNEVSWSGERR